MENNAILLGLLVFPAVCAAQLNQPDRYSSATTFECHSVAVDDTFTVSVQLPREYETYPDKSYPMALLVDGDFYFPTMAPMVRQYEMTGLLPPIILVAIGYGDFQKMDSLRVRDFLHPKSLASDEIAAPGGGLDFYRFIADELLPRLERNFRVDTAQRTLMGHSFGGYFALYAALQQAKEGAHIFSNIISASPTLWYHDFYLYRLPEELMQHLVTGPLNIVLTAGSLEDNDWVINPIYKLTMAFKNQNIENLYLDAFIYNFLDHMDTGQLSFVKGLQMITAAHP